jgi:hypothetical protein
MFNWPWAPSLDLHGKIYCMVPDNFIVNAVRPFSSPAPENSRHAAVSAPWYYLAPDLYGQVPYRFGYSIDGQVPEGVIDVQNRQ